MGDALREGDFSSLTGKNDFKRPGLAMVANDLAFSLTMYHPGLLKPFDAKKSYKYTTLFLQKRHQKKLFVRG